MNVLSVHQPWASAIVSGFKLLENRSWKPPPKLFGHWLLIHATLRAPPLDAIGEVETRIRQGLEYPKGVVVGAVRLNGTVGSEVAAMRLGQDDCGRWWVGPVGWIFDYPLCFATPIPCKGMQGIWKLPAGLEAEAARQVAAARVTPRIAHLRRNV